MPAFINDTSYNQLRRKSLGGTVTGLWENTRTFHGASSFPLPSYPYMTANFTKFEKNYWDKPAKTSYHLSGYGLTFNEAMTSFLGESAERFSYANTAAVLDQFVESYSHRELLALSKTTDIIVPSMNYINIFFTADNDKHYLEPDDVIRWVKLASLTKPGKITYIPLCHFAVREEQPMFSAEKTYTHGSVSTGTACHETFAQSLENAIIEYLQIDSFNLWWYGGQAGVPVKIETILLLKKIFGPAKAAEMNAEFRVTFTDISLDKPISVILCEIEAKDAHSKLPRYAVGLQGGYNFNHCLYRSLLECLTVVEFAFSMPWIKTEHYQSINQDVSIINNLDDNVIYYAKFGKPQNLKQHVTLLQQTTQVNSLTGLLRYLDKVAPTAGFTDITALGFADLNLMVSRINLPELLPVCLPSRPPKYHPRYAIVGGVHNHHPHPLA